MLLLALSVLATLLLIAAGVLAVIVWVGSTRIFREGLRRELPRRPIGARVLEVGDGRVVLGPNGSRRLKQEGTWGLVWSGGSARVADPEPSRSAEGAVRYRLGAVRGVLSVGDECELDATVDRAPAEGSDGPTEVRYPTPLGEFPGRFAAGVGSTWLVVVHGQSNSARAQWRLMHVAGGETAPRFAVSYRNDPGVPATEDGNFHFGRTEWADLEAAIEYAVGEGAERVVMLAESMGAAIALWFMHRSPLASRVDGLFLDAPVLDFATAVDWIAGTSGVPKPVLRVSRALAARRFGMDWSQYDVRPFLGALSVPVQIVHGDRDGQVPVTLSEAAVAENPGHVRLERFAGAGHCQSWNLDPERYERLLAELVEAATARSGEPSETAEGGATSSARAPID